MKIEVLKGLLYDIAAKRDKMGEREYTAEKFYASELGYCPRRLYYSRMKTEKKEPFPKNYFRLEDGTAIHRKIQSDLKELGILVEKEKRLNEPLLGISGHFDGVIKLDLGNGDELILLEIKTINKAGFIKLLAPKRANFVQANFYAIKKGLKKIWFLYYCVDNGEIKEFLELVDIGVYSETIEKIKEVRRCIAIGTPPVTMYEDDCYFCPYGWCCKERKEPTKCLIL